MAIPRLKLPHHEVLSHKLRMATVAFTIGDTRASDDAMLIMDVLVRSQMKAADAHAVAEAHAALPQTFKDAGADGGIAEFADEFVKDMLNRRDPPAAQSASPSDGERAGAAMPAQLIPELAAPMDTTLEEGPSSRKGIPNFPHP